MTSPPPGDGAPRLEVVRADDAHAAPIAEFIRQVWTPSATAESVAASRADAAAGNVAEPGVAPPTWIAMRAGQVLGYVTTIPVRWWDGRSDAGAYWIKGLMVLPEFRNGPIGYAVMKAAAAQLPRSAGLAVATPARRLFVALGYTDLGAIPNWVRPIAPGRVLQHLDLDALGLAGKKTWAAPALRLGQRSGIAGLAGWAGGLALRALAAALRLSGRRFTAGPLPATASGDELDALWSRVRDGFPCSVVRDARYLLPRYPAGTDSPYLWCEVRRDGRLCGIAILRRPRADGDPRLKGIRVATLVDVVYPLDQPDAGLALLGAVERAARQVDADAVLATASSPVLHALLRKQCFLPLQGNVHFLLRGSAADGSAFRGGLLDWWLTRGDGNSDDVF